MQPEKQIRQFLDEIIHNPIHQKEIRFLMDKGGLTENQLLQTWLYWDTSIQTYGNEVYSTDALRLVMHLHNSLKGSWHEKRQKAVSTYLESLNPIAICEFGFGTPQAYVKAYLKKGLRMTLMDIEQSSLTFAKNLLSFWDPNWERCVTLKQGDLNTDDLPPGHDVYLFQDSIEHADDPSKRLKTYVDQVPQKTFFLFSLPVEIENPIPEHHICWKSDRDVLRWLEESGLHILHSLPIPMDKNVDLFALSLHPQFHEIVILAQKR